MPPASPASHESDVNNPEVGLTVQVEAVLQLARQYLDLDLCSLDMRSNSTTGRSAQLNFLTITNCLGT